MTNDEYDKLLKEQGSGWRERMELVERVFFFVVGWDKGSEEPKYISGPFTNKNDALDERLDFMFSQKADAYSIMETVPQVVWPEAQAKTYPGEAAIRQALDTDTGGSS